MRKKIIVISGDPNSINSEIIFKSWKNISNRLKKNIYFISNYDLLKNQFKRLGYACSLKKVKNIKENLKDNSLKIIDVRLKFKDPFNVSTLNASKFTINCLNIGHELALKKDVLGIINCPINKKLLIKKNYGVTDFLAKKNNLKNKEEVMLIKNNKLAVSPITTHIDLKDVHKNIKKDLIIRKVKVINEWFTKNYKKKPKIGVLGLNPHNAELRKDSHEIKEIIPSISLLKKAKINISGPLVADTTFINEYKNYDVIIGMYHDQVLTPFKTLFKFKAINITLGLKYLRASPDHGVASNLIGKNKADNSSFLECLNFFNKLSS
tara:strand:+ start:92 stop:1057 length:966 start_codon:yes stop_codon:yes gene_type:complete